MGRRPLAAMALAWVLVVTAVAAVTFVVVDRAGRGVGQASAARTVAPPPTGSASAVATAGTGGPSTGSPTPEPASTASPGGPRTDSFTTVGGTVVASCTGATLRLVSITPRDGWRFEQGESEVTFTGGQTEVELSLGCVRGLPTEVED